MGCEERQRLRETERAASDEWRHARTKERTATGRDILLSQSLTTRALTKYAAAKMSLEEHDRTCGCIPTEPVPRVAQHDGPCSQAY